MKIKLNNRKIHYWSSIICALPILIVITTGLLLTFKKDSDWIQPSTSKGIGSRPTITFEKIINISKNVVEIEIKDWSDIDRLDVRPKNGIIKIRSKNSWELQIDSQTGEILNIAHRKSDLIEDIHTGNFFHKYVALGIFFPASLILLILWITGLYLFITMTITKSNNKKRKLKFRK
jgi:uncharacterized iron-regulated membrane protein|tara:strand:+ start:1750 stop:2277 length:528 start_codon:yes stop_codon:yes gene_type:complete